ncbi:Eukaryotic translation initiation factor 3 subunit C [Aphelenchoides bicaudatus]|nr:Eukaryotic translation initiation factor 3 subunit C [Aphelenchoides bicaudatus]
MPNSSSLTESDSESWATESNSDASSVMDIDLEGKKMEELRQFFLKKPDQAKKPKEEGEERKKKEREPKKAEGDKLEGEWHKVLRKDELKPLFNPEAEITTKDVCDKLAELTATIGRKGADRKLFGRRLQELRTVAEENELGIGVLAKLELARVTSLLETNSKANKPMDYSEWTVTLDALDSLLNLLVENPNLQFSVSIEEDEENYSDDTKPYCLRGSVIMQLKRLDDELTKIFQNSDGYSNDYIDKLKGEMKFSDLIDKAQGYIDSRENTEHFDIEELAVIYMLRIEHLYYRYTDDPKNEELMERLCKKIYSLKNATLQRQRAFLCQIYHHSLHDRLDKAKELLLMSHVKVIVDHSEDSIQILYDRAMCQFGLCAFRHGYIKEAHRELSDIHKDSQRVKDNLGQGMSRQVDRTPEQEARERSLQVPFHMHINTEVMECVYLVCSMLLEIPTVAQHQHDMKRRVLSRPFHYHLKASEKSILVGPPENTREHIVAAAKAMLNGDWLKCRDFLINEKMNAKIWNLFREPEKIKSMLIERIQKQTLKTHLFMYATVYKSVSVDNLCKVFELDQQVVYSLVQKMIEKQNFSAKLDKPDNLNISAEELTRVELAIWALTQKLN